MPKQGSRPAMGLMFAGSEMASFTLFGVLLDYLLHTLPVLTIVMTLLGTVFAFYQLLNMAKELSSNKPDASDKNQDSDSQRPVH